MPPGVLAFVEVAAPRGTVEKWPLFPTFGGYRLTQPLTLKETLGRDANVVGYPSRTGGNGVAQLTLAAVVLLVNTRESGHQ